jgi:hypothetical protein
LHLIFVHPQVMPALLYFRLRERGQGSIYRHAEMGCAGNMINRFSQT